MARFIALIQCAAKKRNTDNKTFAYNLFFRTKLYYRIVPKARRKMIIIFVFDSGRFFFSSLFFPKPILCEIEKKLFLSLPRSNVKKRDGKQKIVSKNHYANSQKRAPMAIELSNNRIKSIGCAIEKWCYRFDSRLFDQ